MSFHDLWSGEETPAERIVKKGKDYSLLYADKWSWASDGGVHWQEDKQSLYKSFNKEVLSQSSHIWEDYVGYRNCKMNTSPREWTIYYDMPNGEVTEYPSRFDPKHNSVYYVKGTYMTYKRESKVVNHKPLQSDLPEGAIFKRYYRHRASNMSVYWYDYNLIEFLFHRNIIPTTFNSKEELTNWLLRNENRIINSWYKVHSKK